MTLTLHRARVVLPVAAPPLADGAVAVRDGVVIAVGTHDDLTAAFRDEPDLERVEWDGVLTPGLVNAHTHLQYSDMAEVGRGSYAGFEDWSRAFAALYFTPHDWAASAADGARLSLRAGTTAVAEIVTDPAAASAVADAGLHGVVFWEVFGWKAAGWRDDGPARVHTELAAIPETPARGLSPHALYSLDTEVLRDLAALAERHGMRQHIHAAESASEDAFVRSGTGALADQWRRNGYGDFALLAGGGSGLSAIGYLDAVGSLTRTTHLAHGIYVDADDRRILRDRDVAVALCPRSNAVIGLDAPPVAAYLREGNAIAVGTDSLSSSPSLHVLDDVAALYRIARDQGYAAPDLHARLLAAATVGGAHALGLDAGATPTGILTPGARADLAVFPTVSDDPADALAALVEAGGIPALATIVGGTVRSTLDAAPDADAPAVGAERA